MKLCRATLVHGTKRLFRRWKFFVYILVIFLFIQALIALQTNPNLLEEEQAKRIEEYRRRKHEQLANEMLQGERSHLAQFDKIGLKPEVFNPKDPRFRDQFLQLANIDAKVLEEWDLKEVPKVKNKTSSSLNLVEEVYLKKEEKHDKNVEFKPKCDVTMKDAQSAISRATSNQCKQEIADTACKHQDKALFPKSMPRLCPHPGKSVFEAPMPSSFKESLKPVRICYILVVHGRAFRQFRRLLRVIYHRDHYFYIHVDKRSDYLYREIIKETEKYPNVAVAPWRMATIWGGSSLLQMLLHALSDVLRLWSDWDFFVNLSALDFPIEIDEKLMKFLATYRDKNFMKSHGREDEKFIRKQGLNRVFVECDQHMWRLGERELPEGLMVNGGSDWVALNRPFCEYVIHGDDQLLKALKHWYRYTLLPAESFFHTLTQNSDKCETFVDNNLRVTNWNRARGCKCQYKHIVDWCGCSPNDFYPSDLGRLQTSRPVFFARKFEEIINQAVVNHLDFKLYGQYPSGTPALRSYWENCYDPVDGPTSVEDASVTHYMSFARIGLHKINSHLTHDFTQDSSCILVLSQVVQVEIYKHNEEFSGYLVTMDTWWGDSNEKSETHEPSPDDELIRMQVYLSTQSTLRIIDASSDLAKRLESASVGTNWDVKELTLRDWGGIVGPESDVHLVARWRRADDDFVVTVVVIDPLNVVSDYNDFRTPARAAGVTETPLSLRKPMRPGRWVIRFYVQRQFTRVCAEIEFIVVPLEFKNGVLGDARLRAINRGVEDDAQVNAASRNLYTIRTTLNLQKSSNETKKLTRNAQNIRSNALRSWIDEAANAAWKVRDYCLVANLRSEWQDKQPDRCRDAHRPMPNLCSTTNWSSFSPDPKSELGVVKRNGRIR